MKPLRWQIIEGKAAAPQPSSTAILGPLPLPTSSLTVQGASSLACNVESRCLARAIPPDQGTAPTRSTKSGGSKAFANLSSAARASLCAPSSWRTLLIALNVFLTSSCFFSGIAVKAPTLDTPDLTRTVRFSPTLTDRQSANPISFKKSICFLGASPFQPQMISDYYAFSNCIEASCSEAGNTNAQSAQLPSLLSSRAALLLHCSLCHFRQDLDFATMPGS
mmetsp:Transcript_13399/g.35154  ORF Transcript_13399/g.35154 Transcript_13399/m.35154 type:complete len:221 (-) Transcript_13399:145-807(-)